MKKIYFASNFQTNSDSFYFFQQLSTRKFLYFPIFLFHISTNYVRESIYNFLEIIERKKRNNRSEVTVFTVYIAISYILRFLLI